MIAAGKAYMDDTPQEKMQVGGVWSSGLIYLFSSTRLALFWIILRWIDLCGGLLSSGGKIVLYAVVP